MNVKKIMAGILSAAIAFTSVAFTAFANGESTPDWTNKEGATVVAYGIDNDGGNLYFNTLTDALKAVYKSSPNEVVTLECKAGADVGAMTHGHVADSLIIKGNGAYVSSGERDLEVDTFEFDRSTGNYVKEKASDLEKDITIKVENLNGVGGWSQRQTSHTVNLEFVGCKKMHRVYFSGTTGVNNFKLTDCTFDGTNNENDKPVGGSCATSVYSNAPGTIELNNCTFKNVSLGVNLNNKSNGEQIVNINKCSFEDCAISANSKDWESFAAPIRFVTSGETAKITASVAESKITYPTGKSNVGNGDILLGDGRKNEKSNPNVTVNVSKTAAEVQVQFPGEVDKTVKKTLTAADITDISFNMPAAATVAKIGDNEYATLSDAIDAAVENDTIIIIGDIDAADTASLSKLGSKKVTIMGIIDDGKDTLNFSGAVAIQGGNITFKDLSFQWPGDNYMGLQHANNLIYENCTINNMVFLYGNSETFNNCKFIQTSPSNYNVWTYGANVVFNKCDFSCAGKSVLIYNEGLTKRKVEVNDCTFTATESNKKAAIEIDSSKGDFDITVNRSEATRFAAGSTSRSTLYNIKKHNASAPQNTTLTVDNQIKAIDKTSYETMTDSGLYTVNDENFGLMRFSFKALPLGDIKEVGIKFVDSSDITAGKSATVTKAEDLSTFYGDLTEIAPTAGTKYFATAYMVMGDKTVWSDVIECSLNVKKQFTNYGGNQ